MKKSAVLFVLLLALAVIAVFMLSAALLMWLVNIVLTQYDAEQLTYSSALAINGILLIFGGGILGINNSSK